MYSFIKTYSEDRVLESYLQGFFFQKIIYRYMHIALKYIQYMYLHDDHSYSNVNQDHYIVKRCTRVFYHWKSICTTSNHHTFKSTVPTSMKEKLLQNVKR